MVEDRGPAGSNATSSSHSGVAHDLVQARDVRGGIHFHTARQIEERPPRQLPADVPGFVGRAAELAQLHRQLDAGPSGAARLIVIAGTAGAGKSALAVSFAHGVRERFPDGQLFVNLRGYDSGPPIPPQAALERFLRSLGVAAQVMPQGLEERAELFRSLLAGRRLLVVADNAATVGQVRPLLPGEAGCVVLVTSRGRLSGLSAREGAHRLTLGLLPADEAVELVRQAVADYRAGDDDADVAELVRLCSRLPLALRIAAERAAARPLMPLRELIADLRGESSLWDALSTEDATEVDAVRAVFTWSYRALPTRAARAFRLLGLHPSPEFGVGAAAALIGEPPNRVNGLLDLLTGAHLLEQTGPGRYQLHDLLRAYAAGQARQEDSLGDRHAALARCAEWYLRTVENAVRAALPSLSTTRTSHEAGCAADSAPLVFASSREATEFYRTEQANLLATVRATSAAGLLDLTWRLPAALHGMHAVHLPVDDWLEMTALGLNAAAALENPRAEATLRASFADACAAAGRIAEALTHHQSALALREEFDDQPGIAASEMSLGMIHLRSRRPTQAGAAFTRTLTIARHLGDEMTAATALSNLASLDVEIGETTRAALAADEVEQLYRRIGADPRLLATPALIRARVHRETGDFEAAAKDLEAAQQIAAPLDLPLLDQAILLEHGALENARGHHQQALETYWHAQAIGRSLHEPSRDARIYTGIGLTMQALHRTPEALDFHRLAVATYRQLNDTWPLAQSLFHLSNVLAATGHPDEARTARLEAATLFSDFEDPRTLALQRQLRSAIAEASGS